jgi:hypothetical protein
MSGDPTDAVIRTVMAATNRAAEQLDHLTLPARCTALAFLLAEFAKVHPPECREELWSIWRRRVAVLLDEQAPEPYDRDRVFNVLVSLLFQLPNNGELFEVLANVTAAWVVSLPGRVGELMPDMLREAVKQALANQPKVH